MGDSFVRTVVAGRELAALGVTRRTVENKLKSGDWRLLRHGVIQIGERLERAEDQHRLLVRATAGQLRNLADLAVSHASAAVLWNLPVWSVDLTRVHVTRPGRSGLATTKHLAPHRGALSDGEVTVVEGIPVTTLARTVLDMARYHGFARGVVVADAALRAGVERAELQEVVDLARARGSAGSAAQVVEFADARSESVGESRSRVALAVLGLPSPVLQHEFRTATGRFVGRTDFWFEEFSTIGEFDGFTKYGLTDISPVAALIREKEREDELRDLGQQVVRWTGNDLGQSQLLLERFRRAFTRAGHPLWLPEPRPELTVGGSARRQRRRSR